MIGPLKIIFIVGPTAIGKSAVALALARLIKGEIVSCDSMQVYKEVKIATNQPSAADLKKIKHHLVAQLSVSEEFDVVKYRKLALKAIADIQKRGRIPVVVGGSGMYAQVLLDGIFEGAPKNEEIRKKLADVAEKKGVEHLYKQLKAKDPAAAEKIHTNDLRRIIRALEVIQSEKKPISQLQKKRDGLWGKNQILYVGLNGDRQALYQRIDSRVEEMFEAGLVREIKKIKNKPLSQTAGRIIGVREVVGFLDGTHDLQRAKYLIKLNTRHYAKRQLTWFRKDQRIQWFEIREGDSSENIARSILEKASYAK